MSFNSTNEDLRSVKTKKAIYASMFSLLKRISFKKITVKEICEEAVSSRATFYSHFIDKYELLKHWLPELWPKNLSMDDTYAKIEETINTHVRDSVSILKNLCLDADYETFEIFFEFILSRSNLAVTKNSGAENYSKNVVLSNFYAGGCISYFLWQIRNMFPSDVPMMNKYLYEMIQEFQSIK